jgi:NAD(P)-dependent dehydrogenase (short-subunit alcohol dehydrogenase family)
MTGVGRTVVVTGGSSGIGLAAATALAALGDDVVLVGRHPERLARAADRVGAVAAYRADFADLDQVREVGEKIAAAHPTIHVLANNAGGLVAPWRAVTVNHLAGFLLAQLLLPAMARGRARLITTASLAEMWGWLRVDHPTGATLPSRWLAYGAGKSANVLFTVEAARRWTPYGIVPTCFFPGLVRTRFARTSLLFNLARPLPYVVGSPRAGADTLVWLATSDDPEIRPGGYYAFRAPFVAAPWSTSPRRAARLWEASGQLVGATIPYS